MRYSLSLRPFSLALSALLIFGAASSFAGAVMAIAFGGAGIPLEALAGAGFSSALVPGLILGFVVGGTQLAAAIVLLMRRSWAPALAAVAGFGMLIWIFTELAILGYFWLQSAYFGLGLLELILDLALLGIVPLTARPSIPEWGGRH